MQIQADDARFADAGLTVSIQGKTARIFRGAEEVALVAHDAGSLTFIPHRAASHREVLTLIGAIS